MDPVIEKGLAHIRQVRRQTWIVWAGGPPVVASLATGLHALGVETDLPGLFAGYAYLALFAAAAVRADRARCPRCGEPFHRRGFFGNPWTRTCLHCGLPLRNPKPA
jgi:hypothetical protein